MKRLSPAPLAALLLALTIAADAQLAPSPGLEPGLQSGSGRMVAFLAHIASSADPVVDIYLNRARAAGIRSLLDQPMSPGQKLRLRVKIARELLKGGHHGSDTSTYSLMLARLAPPLSVVSVGRRNRYGHPSARVLGRLRAAGTSILRTDLDGTVTVVARADGTFRVGVER